MGRIRIVLAGLAAVAGMAAETAAAASFEAALATRWQWSEGVDRIADRRVSRAILRTVEIADRQLGLEEARLALTCTGGTPVIDIDWSFKAAGRAHLRLEYRFAGQPGRSLDVLYVNRTSQRVSDLSGIRRFLADARLSDRLRLRVTSDLSGVSEATFRAAAGADIYRRFTAACPVAAGGSSRSPDGAKRNPGWRLPLDLARCRRQRVRVMHQLGVVAGRIAGARDVAGGGGDGPAGLDQVGDGEEAIALGLQLRDDGVQRLGRMGTAAIGVHDHDRARPAAVENTLRMMALALVPSGSPETVSHWMTTEPMALAAAAVAGVQEP